MKFKKFQPLKRKNPKIKNVWGFDIETYGEKNRFVLGVLTHKEKGSIVVRSPKEFKERLDSWTFKGATIIATNLAFDFLGTFKHLKENNFSMIERNGRVYSFTYYQNDNKKHVVHFYDTLNYHPASVAELGEILKIPKLPHPKCFGNKPKTKEEEQELITYCENDARISLLFFTELIVSFCERQGIRLKCAMASLSLADFRTNYLKHSFDIESYEVHEMCFNAYYGGRTEVFRRGTYEDISCYDFNSLYPSVMLNELPNPGKSYEKAQVKIADIKRFEGVCYIEGFQEDTFIPLLPYKKDGKLIFPVGYIKGFYTFVELREALQNGFSIHKIGKGVIYTEKYPFFAEFVKDKYELRKKQKKAKDPLEIMTKLSMNSLYGKFGFNYREQNSVVNGDTLEIEDIKPGMYIEPLSGSFLNISSESRTPTSYSIPIWASYVTAFARIKLFRELKKHQDNILYCDTDSIFLKNGVKLEDSKELGDLGLEYFCDFGIFVKPKFYYTKYPKIKGVKHTLRFENEEEYKLKLDSFIRIVEGEQFEQEYFVKYRTALRSKTHHKDGILEQNQIIKRKKKLSNEDGKRVWDNSFAYKEQEESKPIMITEGS